MEKIKKLSQRVAYLNSTLSYSKDHKKYFKNLGRYPERYRILSNGEKQKSSAIEYTMHEDVKKYFNDLNDLIGELLNFSNEDAVKMGKTMFKIYKLPMDAQYVPNWNPFCKKVYVLLSE